MKNSLKPFILGAILAIGMGASFSHAGVLDVVRDSNETPVMATSGDCLRTNWEGDSENCGIKKEEPAPSIKLSTERTSVYFGFGKALLSTEAKKELDLVSMKIKGNPSITSVRITGFADKVGSAAANEKLSKRRADAVRKYLMGKGVFNAQVVDIRWFGDSAPTTSCEKKMAKGKMISCLQPDRRVDVEFDTVAVAPATPAAPAAAE